MNCMMCMYFLYPFTLSFHPPALSLSFSLSLSPPPSLPSLPLQQTDIVDDIPTVKFVYIQWIGEATKVMAKAQVSTHKGDVEGVFTVSSIPSYHFKPQTSHLDKTWLSFHARHLDKTSIPKTLHMHFPILEIGP